MARADPLVGLLIALAIFEIRWDSLVAPHLDPDPGTMVDHDQRHH